ncbi:MAG TPA: hypothetical protein VFU22_18890 [Roseiflexaceae bacterium]|nr:hypothetical protein [Roseiflexaceae bacterium]
MRRGQLTSLLVLVLAFGFISAASARAQSQQQSPITLDVRAGYEGAYRLGEWFPIQIDIGNDGPDLRGVLEWSFPGQIDEQTFRQAIDLPRGARKHVTLDAFARGFARNGQLRVLDGENPLIAQDISLDSADEGVFLAGVISSDPAMLNSLNSLQITGFSSTQVRHLDAADLREHAAVLRGLNALFLHDLDSATLTPAQRDALGLWVSLGGQLIVSGGVGGQQAAAGLAGLLPVQVGGALAQGDLTPLAGLARASALPNPSAPLSPAQPLAQAEQIPPASGLLFRWRYGAGLVTFSAFDFASLRGWIGENGLWANVLTQQSVLAPGYGARLSQTSLLERGVLRLPSLNLPSTAVVLVFLLTYVLVIGPINYLVLRRLRRLEWAWFSVPLVVLVFACGLYAVGVVMRGGQSQVSQAAVVQGAEGQSRGFATGFVGLFSPRRAAYMIGFPAQTLVGGSPGRFTSPDQFEAVVADEAGERSIRVLADVVSVSTFVAEQMVDLPVSVQSSLTNDGSGIHGEVRNTGASALEDVMIVRGSSFARLGTLAPGAAGQVAGNLQQGFPSSAGLADSGPFDRQEILRALFDRDTIRIRNPGLGGGVGDEQGVYLLGWANIPTISATLNGQDALQTGITLYVIRLK